MAAAKQVTATRRLLVAAGPLARAAAPSLLLAIPPLATALVLFAVLMGPTGMHPSDVADAAKGSLAIRVAMIAVALAALAPAAMALGRAEIGYFRWLPVPRAAFWMTGLAFSLALNAPFAVFWLVASGPSAALAILTLGAAFHAALLCRGALRWLLAGSAFSLLVAPTSLPLWTAALGAALVVVAVVDGWRHIAQARAFAVSWVPSGGPMRAIVTVLASQIIHPMVVVRLAVAAVVFGGMGGLLIANNNLSASPAALVVLVSAALGSVGIAAHLATSAVARWQDLRWLLRANATANSSQAAALLVTSWTGAFVCGLAISALACAIGGVGAPLVFLLLTGGGLSGGAVAAVAVMTAARVSERKRAAAWTGAVGMAVSLGGGAALIGLPVIVLLPLAPAAAAVSLVDVAGREVDA